MNKDIQSIFKSNLTPKHAYKGGKNPPTSTKKIYKLSSNENPIGASPKAIAAAAEAIQKVGVYPDQTDIRLREALSLDFDNKIDADQFITGNSGSEVLELVMRSLLSDGDEVIVSNPCFSPYLAFSRWYGASQVDVPLIIPDYSLDVDGILNAITEKTKIIFLTSPNNPTGTYIPKATLDQLMKSIPSDILVVLDEVYRHFADAPDYITALLYVQQGYNILGLNSFSKTYGLAGMRVGYGYTTKVIADYIRQIHRPFLIPLPSLEAGIAALSDKAFIEETVAMVHEGRGYLAKTFDQLNIKYWPSQANFFIIDPPIPEVELADRLMEQGIMVRPVSQFGAPGKVRITVGNPEANEAFVQALTAIVG